MTESLNQHKLLIQLVARKNLKMSSWISKMHLRSQMNYLSTQMQPKTNLIIFGILLSKFISHWIITNYIWTIYVPSFHCIRLMTFVRIDGVFFFFLLEHRFELTLSCTKPILHAQSFAHVAHAVLNDIYIAKLLIQFKHLGKGTISSFFLFFFFGVNHKRFHT